MSDDLISRSELIQTLAVVAKKFAKTEEQQALMGRVFYIIDHKPTAYDVDKVVKQLEEEREYSYADFNNYVDDCSPCLDAEYDDYFHRGIERAIKLVRAGGVDGE